MVPDCLMSVTERSSQEGGSAELRHSAESARRSRESQRSRQAQRKSEESARTQSSASDHSYTLQDVVIEPRQSGKSDSPFASPSVQKEIPQVEIEMPRRQRSDSSPESSLATMKRYFNDYRQRMTSAPPRGSLERSGRISNETRRSSMGSRGLSMTNAESIPAGCDPGAFVARRTLGEGPSSAGRDMAGNMRISLDLGPHRLPSLSNAKVEGRLVRRRRRLPLPVIIFFGIMSVYAAIVATCTLSIGIFNFTKLRASRAARTVDNLRNEIEPQLLEILSLLREMARRR